MEVHEHLKFAKKDRKWVNPDGSRCDPLIEGVVVREARTQTDGRGTLCEIYRPDWGINPDPLTYVYQFSIRPGMIKGWHIHHLHDDRIFISQGEVLVVLYDDRPESPTYKMVNEIYRSEHHRSVMVIPRFVFHAHRNVGDRDALMISFPTRAYDHEDPDVFRLPIKNDYIPYEFEDKLGW